MVSTDTEDTHMDMKTDVAGRKTIEENTSHTDRGIGM